MDSSQKGMDAIKQAAKPNDGRRMISGFGRIQNISVAVESRLSRGEGESGGGEMAGDQAHEYLAIESTIPSWCRLVVEAIPNIAVVHHPLRLPQPPT